MELEEQLRTVTAQRRKAERAAAEVLAILDAQGFGCLSDAGNDSGSEDEVGTGGCDPDAAERDRSGGNAAEDVLSGSEPGAPAAWRLWVSREDVEEYLAAVACLAGAPGPRADAALQVAMARLEDEFRHLLVRGAPPLATEDLQASLLRRLSHGALFQLLRRRPRLPLLRPAPRFRCRGGRRAVGRQPVGAPPQTTRSRPTSSPQTPSAPSGTSPTQVPDSRLMV